MLVEATSIGGSTRKDDTPISKNRKNATTELPNVNLPTEGDQKKGNVTQQGVISDGFETPKNTRIANGYKINSLTPVYNKHKEDQKKANINFELIFQIESKLHSILTVKTVKLVTFKEATNLNQVKKNAREYLDLMEKDEVCSIEVSP